MSPILARVAILAPRGCTYTSHCALRCYGNPMLLRGDYLGTREEVEPFGATTPPTVLLVLSRPTGEFEAFRLITGDFIRQLVSQTARNSGLN